VLAGIDASEFGDSEKEAFARGLVQSLDSITSREQVLEVTATDVVGRRLIRCNKRRLQEGGGVKVGFLLAVKMEDFGLTGGESDSGSLVATIADDIKTSVNDGSLEMVLEQQMPTIMAEATVDAAASIDAVADETVLERVTVVVWSRAVVGVRSVVL